MTVERHTYEYEVDPKSDTAPANVVRMVGQKKRVLEIGCGPGSITKLLSQLGHCRVTGLELDPEAIKRVAPFCDMVIPADLNSTDWPHLLNGIGGFDVVVAADVLEHLSDPWMTLRRMVSLIHQDGYLVISLPHIGHAAVVACLINGDFEYRDWGLLDRTHIRFFGLKNIQDLIAQAGLKIIEAQYVIKLPEETEFAVGWTRLPAMIKAALSSSPHSQVYQVVVKAVPTASPGEPLVLLPPPRRSRAIFNKASLKVYIGARLSPRLKRRIRNGLGLVGVRF